MYVPARDVLLQNVVLNRPADLRQVGVLLLRRRNVERQQDRRRRVDRHRGRDLLKRNALGQRLHVLERGDRYADLANLTQRLFVVRVEADLRRQVEGHREPSLSLLKQELVPLVRLRSVSEPRRTAASSTAARGTSSVDTTGERELARIPQLLVVVPLSKVLGAVERIKFRPRRRFEPLAPLGEPVGCLLVRRRQPVVFAFARQRRPRFGRDCR